LNDVFAMSGLWASITAAGLHASPASMIILMSGKKKGRNAVKRNLIV